MVVRRVLRRGGVGALAGWLSPRRRPPDSGWLDRQAVQRAAAAFSHADAAEREAATRAAAVGEPDAARGLRCSRAGDCQVHTHALVRDVGGWER